MKMFSSFFLVIKMYSDNLGGFKCIKIDSA